MRNEPDEAAPLHRELVGAASAARVQQRRVIRVAVDYSQSSRLSYLLQCRMVRQTAGHLSTHNTRQMQLVA